MIKNFYRKLVVAITSFIICRKAVTAIEYTLVAVAMASVLVVVFNPTTGPFHDLINQAKDSIVAAIENNT